MNFDYNEEQQLLADSVRRSKIEWIGVRHEEGAALAASGQAKLTGRLRRHDRPGQ